MENLYGFFQYSASSSYSSTTPPQVVRSGSSSSDDLSQLLLRAKVASHPLFSQLLHAYIDCHMVGAPPEMKQQVLDGIRSAGEHTSGVMFGAADDDDDPELHQFMETYCNLLVKYKTDLSRPFDEATSFLNHMETQLNSISAATNNNIEVTTAGSSEKGFIISKEEKEAIECKRMHEVKELKDNLLHRYSGYIGNLKQEFSNKKKKEKLPKEAKQILLTWWDIHFKWPYPTDADKVALAEWTGLDQKQVNNWFINQRKRHWKPTNENIMQAAAILDGLYGPLHDCKW